MGWFFLLLAIIALRVLIAVLQATGFVAWHILRGLNEAVITPPSEHVAKFKQLLSADVPPRREKSYREKAQEIVSLICLALVAFCFWCVWIITKGVLH